MLTKKATGINSIFETIQKCMSLSIPFALYKLPNNSDVRVIIGFESNLTKIKIDFESCPAGFVVSSFQDPENTSYLIPANFTAVIKDNGEFESDSEFAEKLKSHNFKTFKDFSLKSRIGNSEVDNSKKYQIKVNKIINSIEKGFCKKVVLSRQKHLGTLTDFNYYKGFENLKNSYPSAFISMVFLPWENQVWMGASPETLVHQNSEGVFDTIALAGTQLAYKDDGSSISCKEALWTQKEIEEQALVSRYIIDCLKKIRVREYIENGPKTIKAGNLLHLASTYSIDSKQINFSNLSSVMLDLLHPTSAVCGMPKENALKLINEIENYDREFYSGYLGPVNIDNDSHLFVNLRTMKIQDNEVYAYAGGGITEDSDCKKEWEETEIKFRTIMAAFDNK